MKYAGRCLWTGMIFLAMLPFNGQAQQPEKAVDHVHPFIGTGAVNGSLSGNNFPGAAVPFGLVQLSPDTRDQPDWDVASGYNYNDRHIYGFSHTHLSGTGVSELFDVLLMPFTGDAKNGPYRSAFSHEDEKAAPGYYQVRLTDHNINAELTATTRTGVHRYTFPAGSRKQVLVDLDHSMNKGSWSSRILNAQIRVVNDRTIEGYRIITGWAKMRQVYFTAEFSRPIAGYVLTEGGRELRNGTVVNGSNVKGVLEFGPDAEPLIVKVALSPVSTANARENLQAEAPGWDFDAIRSAASGLWEQELQKIVVEGSEKQKDVFYTALYHAFLQPNTISDVNGDYMASNYVKSNTGKGRTHYSTFSLWDTYRAAHPLYTLVQPERNTDFVKSLVDQYETYGYLPVWQLWGQENYCMIGNHSIPVIADAVLKNMPGIDIEKAYEAVKNSSLISHPNAPFDVWEKYGYMPENIQSQSVSITLELAFDDWCVAQMAKKLGRKKDYERFMHRSGFYANLHNHETRFFQSRDDKGNWIQPFDPYKYGANGGNPFTEGNAWQYYWYVPHNVKDLIALSGGEKSFAAKLDSFFTITTTTGEVNGNASGLIGQYAHGNEPSHHVAYLFNYAGQPWKTQFYVSKIMNELYNTLSSGYVGNEDCGQMSSWFVFSAMGFYPVNPSGGVYVIGSPLLRSASITLPGGKSFRVRADKKSEEDIYIQSATLNGVRLNRSYITHEEIEKGGVLEFKMGPRPSATWGTKAGDRPLDSVY